MYSIFTPDAPQPSGTFSQGASAARYVFVSGQLPIDPASGVLRDASIGVQTVQVIRNVEAVLADVGLGIDSVCKVTLFLTDLNDLEAVDEVCSERFEKPYPARSVVGVSALPHGASIQMECVTCR